VCKRSGG